MSQNFCSFVCVGSGGHNMCSARVITGLNGMSELYASRDDVTV